MKNIFRKVATIAGSALMIGATAAMAAAAAYPAPFVENGAANVAVVYGSTAAVSDVVGAANIGSDLATELAAQTASGGTTSAASVSGEGIALSSGSTKIWLNTSLNTALTTLTKTDLPTILGEYTFSGNVDSKITSTLTIGTNNVTFAKQPSSNDDPVIGITTVTSSSRPLYTAAITMPAIAFNHSDSEGETIELFGRTFIVSTATDGTNLVLFSSAEQVNLVAGGSSPNPSATVTIADVDYVIELVTGTSTTATIAIDGTSKEINEGSSKKVGGIDIAVKSVTESTALDTVTASILVGSNKLTFTNGTQVLTGSDDDPVDGTYVTFTGATPQVLTGLSVAVYAPDTSTDAVLVGESFTDPVFGSFKLDFSGLNVPLDSDARDTIMIDKAGDKGMSLTLTDSDANTNTFDFVYNTSSTTFLADSNSDRISLLEGQPLGENNFTMVGNEDYGHLIQVTRIYNNTGTSYSKDAVSFKDVMSGDPYTMDPTSEGAGRLTIDGRQYTVAYVGSGDTGNVTLTYPTSDSSATQFVLFPTIKTANGALVSLYEPQTINLSARTGILIPDGDGYTTVATTYLGDANGAGGNWTVGTTNVNLSTGGGVNTTATIGKLVYHINSTGTVNQSKWTLVRPGATGTEILQPAIVLFEGKDDSSNYEAVVIDVEAAAAGTSSDPLGVNDVYFSSPTVWDGLQLRSDSDITESLDWFGTMVTEDSNTASQKIVTISYPKEQVYANVFVSETDATVSGGTVTGGSATELGAITVEDSEVASVASKNLIVVGGSCVNTVASELLDGAACGESFTTASGIAAGEAIIKSFDRSGKTALLVAGFNAADTTKAVTYLTNNAVDTTVDAALKVTSATEATAMVA
jgi:hypothetical protein